MKYRKRRYASKKNILLPIIAILVVLLAFYVTPKLFRKEVVEEQIEEVVEEVIEEKVEEVFIEELEVIEEKIALEELGLELKEKKEEKFPRIEEEDFSNISDKNPMKESSEVNLEKPYRERDLEKGELIKKAEKGLNEWRDDETLFEYLKEESLKELEKKEEERLGE